MIKRHYEKHYKARYQERAHLVFLLDAILVLAALGLLGLGCYFRWFYHPLRDDFNMSLVTKSEVIAGRETTFEVRIINGGKTDLQSGRLKVYLPEMFVPKEVPDTYDVASRSILIDTLPTKASAAYAFRGTVFGAAGSANIYVHFTARTDDGRSDEKLLTGTLGWEKNAIETRFELPETVVPGQSLAFKLRVKNGTDFNFDRVVVTPKWPTEVFTLQNATPPLYRGAIALGRLEAGEETTIGFSGRFVSLLSSTFFNANVSGVLNGKSLALSLGSEDVRMTDAGLRLWSIFEGEEPAFVKPGQEVPVIVRYHNNGAQTIKNLKLEIAADARTIAGMRWETSNVIDVLAPDEIGERKVFVRVLDVVSQYAVNPLLRVTPQATFSIAQPRVDNVPMIGITIDTKISGAALLRTNARFYTGEGDQIGRGPLPPQVGKTTRYWVFASLETGGSSVQNGAATFRLPLGVAWTGRAAVTSGDELALEGDRLVWRLGTLPAHAGILAASPSASFELAITPTVGQVGTTPLLLSESVFTGQDSWTGIDVSSVQPGITTQLPGDPGVKGRSLVKP